MSLIFGLFCKKLFEKEQVNIRENTVYLIKYQWIFSIESCWRTASTKSLEQKKQTQRRTFIIFVTKPTWKTGFANSMCPKWPGHSVMLPKNREFRTWHQINAVTQVCLQMPTRTSTCTCLASSSSFYDPLSWVHEATKLWTSSFCCFGVFDSPFCDGHPFLERRFDHYTPSFKYFSFCAVNIYITKNIINGRSLANYKTIIYPYEKLM